MSRRRKTEAIDAPQSTAEAIAVIAEYSNLERRKAAIAARYEEQLAKLEEEAARMSAVFEQELQPRFRALAAWWAANETTLTDGKRRSIELAGVRLGLRATPPKLKLPRGETEAGMIAKLMEAKRGELLGVKYSLDKAAIIKLLGDAEEAPPLTAIGLSTSTKDEFFIAVGASEPETAIDPADPPRS